MMKSIARTTKIGLPILVISSLILLWGCTGNVAYENYMEIPEGGWHQNDPAVFSVEIADTNTYYNLFINIRHDVNYKYRNLWVFADIDYPDGRSTSDTIEFVIGNKEGKWLGKGLGKTKEDNILLSRNIRFVNKGEYLFSFRQGMREEDQILENINDFGISVVKVK